MNYRHIQLGYLDTIADGDQELRGTLLGMVIGELGAALPEIQRHLAGEDWEALHQLVHQLKSTLAFVGNDELAALNQHLLSCLEEKRYEADLAGYFIRYRDLCRPILEELAVEAGR